eukprot:c6650_g1_i3.p1 GENE.c6650_g1_i3~~c6650_g1_i3.p1  ORF type:complete len:103 (+),score=13.06 c6650_g1_i3:201-509(+)
MHHSSRASWLQCSRIPRMETEKQTGSIEMNLDGSILHSWGDIASPEHAKIAFNLLQDAGLLLQSKKPVEPFRRLTVSLSNKSSLVISMTVDRIHVRKVELSS